MRPLRRQLAAWLALTRVMPERPRPGRATPVWVTPVCAKRPFLQAVRRTSPLLDRLRRRAPKMPRSFPIRIQSRATASRQSDSHPCRAASLSL